MGKDNLMGLFEVQDYISSGRHEWNVPKEAKDKVAKMVRKYNERAEKKGYESSVFKFDEATQKLSGIFTPKSESQTFFGQLKDGANNGDLSEDIQNILRLCTKVCPHCHNQIPALAKECEVCGKQFLQDKAKKDIVDADEEVQNHINLKEVENGIGVKYKLFDVRTTIELPDGISYYDDILSSMEKFIAMQNTEPKNEVTLLMALDLDKIDPADEENMTDDDPRLGINSFGICNVVFSKYNEWMPLFEEKVNSGKPQIFISVMDWQADLNKVAKFATESCISYAFENGIDRYDKEYAKIILSFDDDVKAATNFLCNVATDILSVPKDVPVTIDINSYQSKAKAQKEYKKNNTFGAKDFAKGAMLLLKDKITGK